MRELGVLLITLSIGTFVNSCNMKELDFSQYPAIEIANEAVRMKIYLPDKENGLYRATRFDWSGVIGSVQYQGHEYFGYWKPTHDPLFHEDLMGPVEGFIKPGLNYEDAGPGEGFIRIGVGILKKEDEPEYDWRETYEILDHGKWTVDHGEDWVTFTHDLQSDFGFGYRYVKTVQLNDDGFTLFHTLANTGGKPIETDQFNHNFFMIDGEESGPAFEITLPYAISTESDLKGCLNIRGNRINFLREMNMDSVFIRISGFSQDPADHRVTVLNTRTGAGATYSVDRPLYDMAFWACASTLSPENSIWISVAPGEEERWRSDYVLFTE